MKPPTELPLNPTLKFHTRRHKDYGNSPKSRPHTPSAWDRLEFIAWDGEGTAPDTKNIGSQNEFVNEWARQYENINGTTPLGIQVIPDVEPQPYVLLAHSRGNRIVNEKGLSTTSCLEFLLNSKQEYPYSVFVGFGFNYDIAQILKDLPWRRLEILYKNNVCYWRRYRIEWRPRKWLKVKHIPTRRRAAIYDVFGFFQSNFISACEKYLGKDDPELVLINKGKAARDTFTYEELKDFIIPYNEAELRLLVRMMDALREDLHNIGLNLGSAWYGPGAVANQLLKLHNIKSHMSVSPDEVRNAAQYAYAGGRFEQFQLGCHQGIIYEYDIRSAYPAAATRLPSLSKGHWEHTTTFEHDSFGVWYINYAAATNQDLPQPLFCRAPNGSISFPREVRGFYWTPEATLVPDHIQYGWIWRTATTDKPFSFVEGMYEDRRRYKQQKIACERAIKLALNSIYGKLAQTIGGKDKPPPYHQLEWAGWITSYVRAMIYEAIMLNPSAIIAAETDAVFSTEPLSLDLGEGLGQWELTTFNEITYLQSGFYYADTGEEIVCRYRGMDRDRETKQPVRLPYRTVLDHLCKRGEQTQWRTKALHSSTTRFINLGLALQTSAVYRTWETQVKRVHLDQGARKSKRYHMNCPSCQQGFTLADRLHPMNIGGYAGKSHPRLLPWLTAEDEEYTLMMNLEGADAWQ